MANHFLITTTIEALLLVGMLLRRAYRPWVALFVYVALDLLSDVVLVGLLTHPRAYFYTYWGWDAASSLLRFFIINDILGTFTQARFMLPELRWGLAATAGSLTAASWFFSLHDAHSVFKTTATIMDGAVVAGWVVFLLVCLASFRFFHLRINRRTALVICGLIIQAAACLLADLIRPSSSASYVLATKVICNASACAFSLWIVAVVTPSFKELRAHFTRVANHLKEQAYFTRLRKAFRSSW